jgi:hypothetical protein
MVGHDPPCVTDNAVMENSNLLDDVQDDYSSCTSRWIGRDAAYSV